MTPMQAAFHGMREISGPVIAMTITLAAVFAPLAFTGGLTGRAVPRVRADAGGRRRDFRHGRADHHADDVGPHSQGRTARAGSRRSSTAPSSASRNRYERLLTGSLKYRPVTLMMVIVLTALTGYLFTKTSVELAPEEDAGALFAIVNAPRLCDRGYTTSPMSTRCGS